jgi:hypothetical protein
VIALGGPERLEVCCALRGNVVGGEPIEGAAERGQGPGAVEVTFECHALGWLDEVDAQP